MSNAWTVLGPCCIQLCRNRNPCAGTESEVRTCDAIVRFEAELMLWCGSVHVGRIEPAMQPQSASIKELVSKLSCGLVGTCNLDEKSRLLPCGFHHTGALWLRHKIIFSRHPSFWQTLTDKLLQRGGHRLSKSAKNFQLTRNPRAQAVWPSSQKLESSNCSADEHEDLFRLSAVY